MGGASLDLARCTSRRRSISSSSGPAVWPRFSLAHQAKAGAVEEICQRLDGIPLAIELAASRMASMTPSEVRDRLDHRFRLLVGSRRGLERHQTLHHAVAWSYDLSRTRKRQSWTAVRSSRADSTSKAPAPSPDR